MSDSDLSMDFSDIGYTGIVKYSILIVLYFFSFIYIYKTSSQFLFYICLFILNFFLVAFILNDIYSNKEIMNSLMQRSNSSIYRFAFYIMLLGGIGQFIALLISLIVFSYATHQVKDAKKYNVISDFKDVLFNFKTAIACSTFFIGLSAFLTVFINSPENYKELLKKIVFVGLSVGIVGLVGYEIALVVQFFKVKKRKLKLYNIIE